MKVFKSFKKSKLSKVSLLSVLFVFLVLLRTEPVLGEVTIAILDSGSRIEVDKGVSFTSLPIDVDPLNHGTKITQVIKDQNPNAKILMIQICEKTKSGYAPDMQAVIKGIKWAKAQGADIINLSLNLDYSEELSSLIKLTHIREGVIFVVAAGNNSFQEKFVIKSDYVSLKNTDDYRSIKFPANLDSVISVGATDGRGKIADYSSKGADVYIDGRYGKEYGTSIAAAKVSGRISKVLPRRKNRSIQKIKVILK